MEVTLGKAVNHPATLQTLYETAMSKLSPTNPKILRALKRRYAVPPGFSDYRKWLNQLAVAAELVFSGSSRGPDYANAQFMSMGAMYFEEKCPPPHYWLLTELFKALTATTVERDAISEVENVFCYQFVMHLPEGEMMSPFDGCLQHVHCMYLKAGRLWRGVQVPDERIIYTAATDTGAIFAGIFSFKDKSDTWDADNALLRALDRTVDPKTDKEFTLRIESLVYQVFLVGQSRSELMEQGSDDVQLSGLSSRKQKQRLQQTNKPFAPGWIGKRYKPSQNISDDDSGSHASPRAHLRQGHWRRQPYGSRDTTQYRTIWIEPTVIGV